MLPYNIHTIAKHINYYLQIVQENIVFSEKKLIFVLHLRIYIAQTYLKGGSSHSLGHIPAVYMY